MSVTPALHDDYITCAQRHRPTDSTAIAAEVRRLHTTGLRPRDIASALRVHPQIVLILLGQVSA